MSLFGGRRPSLPPSLFSHRQVLKPGAFDTSRSKEGGANRKALQSQVWGVEGAAAAARDSPSRLKDFFAYEMMSLKVSGHSGWCASILYTWVNFVPSVFGNMRGTIRGGGGEGRRGGSPQRERKNCTVVSARSQGRRRHVKYALPQGFVRFAKTQQFCEKIHSAFPIVRIRSAAAVLWTFPASHFCTRHMQTLIGRGPHKKAGEC